MRSARAKIGLLILTGVLALGLAWTLGSDSSEAQQGAMHNCPQPGRWAISVWGGENSTDIAEALGTCGPGAVAVAYDIDPETQGWLRWFGERPEVSNLQSLDESQGVIALGAAGAAAAEAAVDTLGAAQADQTVNCPQAGKWSIAVWNGSDGTDTSQALATCVAGTVAAAYSLDPETQGWLRWFDGRPEVSNLTTLSAHQGLMALGAGGTTPAGMSFSLDESIAPSVSELAGYEDGAPRPLASIAGETGTQGDFVANELILITDDQAALNAFLARWDGEILETFDPAEYDLAGLTPMYLVRINTDLADASQLEDEIQALAGDAGGAYRVSSQQGLNLLAAAASEAADGSSVGVNWVGQPADYAHGTTAEAPTAPGGPNAYNWNFLRAGGVQDIGVTEAWTALDMAGRLKNKVKIAILDGGFAPSEDFPAGYEAITTIGYEAATGTPGPGKCSGFACPWHGTGVVGAAMGVPDNGFGAAGPAGPVANALTIRTRLGFFSMMTAIATAQMKGAKIINMSYGFRAAFFDAGAKWFESVIKKARGKGILLFAAAGNENQDVDHTNDVKVPLFPFGFKVVKVEPFFYLPCENQGVICVGALAPNSNKRDDSYSNWGDKDVDIFAPGTVLVGPDPDHPGNIARWVAGTSEASPYAAGVAALIWAADPNLSADQVENILLTTAHTGSPDDTVDRWVNAYDAVIKALGGNEPPEITIFSPEDGESVSANRLVVFVADATDREDGTPTVTWSALRHEDQEPGHYVAPAYLGNGTNFEEKLSYGTYTITATAEDSHGSTAEDSITVTAVNDAPIVQIAEPPDGSEFYEGEPIHLRATSSDINEPGDQLADAQISWTLDIVGNLGTGHERTVNLRGQGTHTITVRGTDSEGLFDEDSITLEVGPEPTDHPPTVQITNPSGNTTYGFDGACGTSCWYKDVELQGQATDPEDGALSGSSLVWTTDRTDVQNGHLGTGTSLTARLYSHKCTSPGITHNVTLTARDSGGNERSAVVSITLYSIEC